jgi:hypothetical protein
MKKLSFMSITAVGLFVCFCSASHAIEGFSLDGNSYKVFMFCMDDAGDYCDENELNDDKFYFDDGDFEIESFDDELWGLGGLVNEGEYDENEFSFDAEYGVYNEELGKYDFDINGINLMDNIIIGIMEIEYSEFVWYELSYEKEEEATAYFIGIKD